MKYTVEVKKLTRTIVKVDAESKKAAMEKARQEATFGSVLWGVPHLRTRLVRRKKPGGVPSD